MTRNAQNTTRNAALTVPVAQYRSEADRTQAIDDAQGLIVMLDDCRTLFALLNTDSRWNHDPASKRARDMFAAPHVKSMLNELERIALCLGEEARNGRVG